MCEHEILLPSEIGDWFELPAHFKHGKIVAFHGA